MEALEDVPYVAARAALPEHLEQRKKRGSDRMRYIADTTEFQIEEPTIVTLGKFDGRHRGHQKLLRTMMELKAETGYPHSHLHLWNGSRNSSHGKAPDRHHHQPGAPGQHGEGGD